MTAGPSAAGEQIRTVTLDSPTFLDLSSLMSPREGVDFQFVQPFLLRKGKTASQALYMSGLELELCLGLNCLQLWAVRSPRQAYTS